MHTNPPHRVCIAGASGRMGQAVLALVAAAGPHRIEWHWVRGHSGHVENERVDAAARASIPGSAKSKEPS